MSRLGIYASQISGHLSNPQFESIATINGTGSSASVTFSSIPGTFKHLQLRMLAATTRGTYGIDSLLITLNGDTATNYAWHSIYGDGSTAAGQSSASSPAIGNPALFGTTTTGGYGAGILDLLDYTSTNKTKVTRLLAGTDFNGTVAGYGGRVGLSTGLWNSTSAVTSITLTAENGNIANYSKFALYGIKG